MMGALAAYLAFIVEHPIFSFSCRIRILYLMFLAGLEIDLKNFIISPTILKNHFYNVVLFFKFYIYFIF